MHHLLCTLEIHIRQEIQKSECSFHKLCPEDKMCPDKMHNSNDGPAIEVMSENNLAHDITFLITVYNLFGLHKTIQHFFCMLNETVALSICTRFGKNISSDFMPTKIDI